MSTENGEWIIRGLDWDDPLRIRTYEELICWIEEVGFLPLFGNEVKGFSVEEHTAAQGWWSGDPQQDPWTWREIIARSQRVAYGKFFNGRAGFISKEWLPVFANYRRDGYDFDSRWEDELASRRSKKIMDQFVNKEELMSSELKKLAGFGKGGEKNFEGTVTELQMQTYLVVKDFRQKTNKKGQKYGWPISVYTTPESLFGYGFVSAGYREDPAVSKQKIFQRVKELFPNTADQQITKVCG